MILASVVKFRHWNFTTIYGPYSLRRVIHYWTKSVKSQITPPVLRIIILKNPGIFGSLFEMSTLIGWQSQVLPKFSLMLQCTAKPPWLTPMWLLETILDIQLTLKANWNTLLGSDTLQYLMLINLYSNLFPPHLKAPINWNTFCWWTILLSILQSSPQHTLLRTLQSIASCSLPIALNATLPTCFTVCSQFSSQDTPKYTSKYTP